MRKLKIGIDIDGVIFDSENEIRVQAELDDLLLYRKNGVIHSEGFLEKERYEWTQSEVNQYQMQMKDILLHSSLMPGAKRVLDLLKRDGHELIIITARRSLGLSVKGCIEQFKSYGLQFDQYYWNINNKFKICKQENIDIMIDGRPTHIKEIAVSKIKALYFHDINREKIEENGYIKEVNHWEEIYRQIVRLSEEVNNK